jgi:NADH-quinone oxidoreductase subunit G
VLLPAATVAEADGTYVNFEGRAQRFEAAWFPRGEARPHADLAAALGRGLGLKTPWRGNREVWVALSPKLAGALGPDFSWDSLPSAGRRRGFVPLAAGTVDGRLAGQRDRMAPEGAEPLERGVAPSGW